MYNMTEKLFTGTLNHNKNKTKYTCISKTKSLIWSCEKNKHAYVSIWWCLMHDIIIEIREKASVHVHLENKHTRVEMETIVSLYTEKVKRGSGGASPPEANGMKRSQIKWKLLLFDESVFFLLRPVLFSFIGAMLFILSQIKKQGLGGIAPPGATKGVWGGSICAHASIFI